MWPFKSKTEKLTDAQGELLELLKEQKQQRIEAERAKAALMKAQASAAKEAVAKKSQARAKMRTSARVHLEAMHRYLDQMSLQTDQVRKKQLEALVEDRKQRCEQAGIMVEATLKSVESALNGG